MQITLSRSTTICQSVAEVLLTDVAPLGAVSHRFIFFSLMNKIVMKCTRLAHKNNDYITLL